MSTVPQDLRYTKEHEWVRTEETRVVVGITDHAQVELTDVVYVELPAEQTEVEAGEEFAVVESVKAASEIYAPVSGDVVEVNRELEERPELINEDPYGRGWIAVFEMRHPGQLEDLLTSAQYEELTRE